jgi:hypothetical protein
MGTVRELPTPRGKGAGTVPTLFFGHSSILVSLVYYTIFAASPGISISTEEELVLFTNL